MSSRPDYTLMMRYVFEFDAIILQQLMNIEELLRQENYQLKNEITDLKNAFDLNRDILKILSTHNYKADPQHNLFMHIIIRLTNVNNLAMISNTEFLFEKNVLKQENWRLNQEVKMLEERLSRQIKLNQQCNQPSESKFMMQEQFNKLNKELMAANEQRIIKEQQIFYLEKSINQNSFNEGQERQAKQTIQNKIKRRFASNQQFRYEILYNESLKEVHRLQKYAQELEYRLLILIKAHRIKQQGLLFKKKDRRQSVYNEFDNCKEEIKLLKYALNDIQIEKKDHEYILTVTERFKQKDKLNNNIIKQRNRKSCSWPKGITKKTRLSQDSDQEQLQLQVQNRITQRFY